MWSRSLPQVRWRLAGVIEILSGSMKTWKHSSMPSLQVMVGSKMTSSPLSWAFLFFALRFGVRDRSSCLSIAVGLYLGDMLLMHFKASVAHLWGFLHPPSLSQAHSMQMHSCDGTCSVLRLRVLILRASLIRSATVLTEWFFNRHFVATFVSAQGTAPW